MRALAHIFISWLPLAIAVTGLSLLCYVSAQQVLRQSMNDMPVQVAQDAVARINAGEAIADVAQGNVNIGESVAPFVIVYDQDGKLIAGSGALDGQVPTPPHGVFDNVDFWRWGHSWQPNKNVRIDAAIIPFKSASSSGFVLGGRNVRLMEDHIVHIGYLVLQAWILLLIATFFAKSFARYFS